MGSAYSYNSRGKSALNFGQLLAKKASLLSALLGSAEFARIRGENFTDENSFDINPEFESPQHLNQFWSRITTMFSQQDPSLEIKRNFTLENRQTRIKDDLFNPVHKTGLTVLVVGCYHTDVFNAPDLVEAAKAFLETTCADDYLLITACNEEVMFARNEDAESDNRQYQNRFFELLMDPAYEDRVFPMRLPDRPEFHFSGTLRPRLGTDGNPNLRLMEGCVGFETHHFECDQVRNRIETNGVENFLLAFRSFARYAMASDKAARCIIDRDSKAYKKYPPEFFFVYRQQAPYLRGIVTPDLSEIFRKTQQ